MNYCLQQKTQNTKHLYYRLLKTKTNLDIFLTTYKEVKKRGGAFIIITLLTLHSRNMRGKELIQDR